MSTVSERNIPPPRDFDYWEFVHCSICFLSFIADPVNAPTAPPSVPFWLTECGHTLCNNHLHADQSCAACGASAIQLVPLQRDMMPPMCDWFRSVPHSLDAIASAAKSQQETMASLVRFYKRKCTQQRASMNKTKEVVTENKALRSQIEQLQHEIAQLRESAGGMLHQNFDQRVPYGPTRQDAVKEALSYQPSETRNVNGKRPLADVHPNRTSSPRSIITPIAPSRITLPPDHQQPVFSRGMNPGNHHDEEIRDRPGSSRFEHYAYQLPATTFRAPPLRHQQQPRGQERIRQEDRQQQQQVSAAGHHHHNQQQQQQQGQGRMHQGQDQQQQQQVPAAGHRHHVQQQQQQQRVMPPPQTPSRAQGSINGRAPFRPAGQILPQSVRRTQVQDQGQPPAPPPSAAPPPQSRPQHVLKPRPFPMSGQTPQSSRSVKHGSSGMHGNTSLVPTERRFAVPSTPSNRFFPPRNTAGVVVGIPGMGYMSSNNGGSSARAPFVPGNS